MIGSGAAAVTIVTALAGFAFLVSMLQRSPSYVAADRLPVGFDVATHFGPSYEPWDQRLRLAEDGDLFEGINRGDADVVTAHIDQITPTGSAGALRTGTSSTTCCQAGTALSVSTFRLRFLGARRPTGDAAKCPERSATLVLASSTGFGREASLTLRHLAIAPNGQGLLRGTRGSEADASRGIYDLGHPDDSELANLAIDG